MSYELAVTFEAQTHFRLNSESSLKTSQELKI